MRNSAKLTSVKDGSTTKNMNDNIRPRSRYERAITKLKKVDSRLEKVTVYGANKK